MLLKKLFSSGLVNAVCANCKNMCIGKGKTKIAINTDGGLYEDFIVILLQCSNIDVSFNSTDQPTRVDFTLRAQFYK